MELFWAIFWIALLIIPALYLAQLVFGLVMMAIVFTIGGIISGVQWIFNTVRGK